MKKPILIALVVVVLVGCAGALLGGERAKRALFASKCEEKVQPIMKFVALFSVVAEPDKKVCGCLAEKIDLARVESVAFKPKEERDAAVAALLMENMPLIRNCALETGVLPARK